MSIKNEIGKTFGRWTVLRDIGKRSIHGMAYWECRCECGNIRHVRGDSLRRGTSTQCIECARKKKKMR